jgi:hypothetical protein
MCHTRRRRHDHHSAPDFHREPAPQAAPDLRVADEDRDHAITLLGQHAAAGRLSAEELEERSDQVLAARTHGELDAVFADLPDLPDLPRARPRRERSEGHGDDLREHLTAFLLVNLVLIAIWAATGAGYFWPIWPLLGWGIGVLSHVRGRSASSARRGSRAYG